MGGLASMKLYLEGPVIPKASTEGRDLLLGLEMKEENQMR